MVVVKQLKTQPSPSTTQSVPPLFLRLELT